jgi:hypothetical protein
MPALINDLALTIFALAAEGASAAHYLPQLPAFLESTHQPPDSLLFIAAALAFLHMRAQLQHLASSGDVGPSGKRGSARFYEQIMEKIRAHTRGGQTTG